MPPRIPTKEDFSSIESSLPHTLHFPSPPESTTAILILFHGLGDTHTPFSSFASAVNLPGVLAISVRGTSRLPLAGGEGYHWGDDVLVDEGGVDSDPGFKSAEEKIMKELVDGVLTGKCGWDRSDILLFGFGQGGSLALGLASNLRREERVTDVSSSTSTSSSLAKKTFKGVVSIGGPLPASMVPTISSREKSKTKVCLVQLTGDKVSRVKDEFEDVRTVNWQRREVAMPRNREEMFPIMKFLADRLNSGWQS